MFDVMKCLAPDGTLSELSAAWHTYSCVTAVKLHCNHGNANLDHKYELENVTQMTTNAVSLLKVIDSGTSKAGRV